jgi:hypothetical protein
MSVSFEKLLKQAIEYQCDLIQLDNESSGFEIYLISNNTGFPANLTEKELNEVVNFIFSFKKSKKFFNYLINNIEYKIDIKWRTDFGEQVFSLKLSTKN